MSKRQIYFANNALIFMSKIPLFTSKVCFIFQPKRSINFNNLVRKQLNQLVILNSEL